MPSFGQRGLCQKAPQPIVSPSTASLRVWGGLVLYWRVWDGFGVLRPCSVAPGAHPFWAPMMEAEAGKGCDRINGKGWV